MAEVGLDDGCVLPGGEASLIRRDAVVFLAMGLEARVKAAGCGGWGGAGGAGGGRDEGGGWRCGSLLALWRQAVVSASALEWEVCRKKRHTCE